MQGRLGPPPAGASSGALSFFSSASARLPCARTMADQKSALEISTSIARTPRPSRPQPATLASFDYVLARLHPCLLAGSTVSRRPIVAFDLFQTSIFEGPRHRWRLARRQAAAAGLRGRQGGHPSRSRGLDRVCRAEEEDRAHQAARRAVSGRDTKRAPVGGRALEARCSRAERA